MDFYCCIALVGVIISLVCCKLASEAAVGSSSYIYVSI